MESERAVDPKSLTVSEHQNNSRITTGSDTRGANIRDALLWGAAFVPFLALALLPRRSQLNKLRGEISSLSRQSSKQSKSTLEALAQLRQAQDDAIRELREQLAANANMLSELKASNMQSLAHNDTALKGLSAVVIDAVSARDLRDDNQAALNLEALTALKEARNLLDSSKRYVSCFHDKSCRNVV